MLGCGARRGKKRLLVRRWNNINKRRKLQYVKNPARDQKTGN